MRRLVPILLAAAGLAPLPGCGSAIEPLRDRRADATETMLIGACEPGAPIEILDYELVGRELFLEVRHGGGCERHTYMACMEDPHPHEPQRYTLRIRRDDHGDMCRGEVTAILQIELDRDLTVLRQTRDAVTLE